jgi:hypothetical protein
MCMCVYLFVRVCEREHVRVCVCACERVCVHVRVCVRARARVCVFVAVCLCDFFPATMCACPRGCECVQHVAPHVRVTPQPVPLNRLGLLHPELPIIQLLQRQAAEVSASMLSQLLQRLRGSIQVKTPARATGAGRTAKVTCVMYAG